MASSGASSAATPVIVVTGTSGAGKGSIERILLNRMPELELAVSATTREQRPNEIDGKHYWFVSDEEFDRKLEEKAFLEYITFPWGQRSGTLRSEIDRIRDKGRVPLLDLETDERLALARQQLTEADLFDHVIVNDDLERAADEVESIVRERIAATMAT